MTPRLLTIQEASQYCSLSTSGFQNWIDRGLLPGPIAGTKRYDRHAIDRALDKASGLADDTEPSNVFDTWLRQDASKDPDHAHHVAAR